MRYLKKFWESNEYTSLEETLREYNLKLDHILPDGSVDVTGSLEFSNRRFAPNRHIRPETLPFRINHLEGHFVCDSRMDISTLESTPRSISGSFEIKNCGITNLEGGPERVGGSYWINGPITSLEGSPIEVYNFMISNGKMTNLVGSPQFVGFQYTIVNCLDLTSLEGISQNVGRRVHIETCPNLWDAGPLRNVDVEFINLYKTPLWELVRIFGSPKNFKDSLDYNYIKFDRVEGCVINLFKFKEALHEFDIDYMNSFEGKPGFSDEGFGAWKFVDEEGRLCKFN